MSSKAKGVVALILVVAVLANVGIFAKMSYNKTHTAQETIVFRVGDTVASDHPISQALYMFEEELERISNGRFDVRVYINSALGGDRQQTESVILGYMQGNTPPLRYPLHGGGPALRIQERRSGHEDPQRRPWQGA